MHTVTLIAALIAPMFAQPPSLEPGATDKFANDLIARAAPDLAAIVAPDAKVELVADGFKFTEGPVWSPQGYLLFSDIPEDTIYKWIPGQEGKPEVFRKPSGFS